MSFEKFLHDLRRRSGISLKEVEMYHGSSEEEPRFRMGHTGINSTVLGAYEVTRWGVFFTDNPEFAKLYGDVKPYEIKVTSTIDLDGKSGIISDFIETLDDRNLWHDAMHKRHVWQFFEGEIGERFASYLKGLGYDSAKFTEYNDDDDGNEIESQTLVVLDLHKIRKVGNRDQMDLFDSVLTEAPKKQYHQMFDGLKNLFGQLQLPFYDVKVQELDNMVKDAIVILKLEPRIIWFLRGLKVSMMSHWLMLAKKHISNEQYSQIKTLLIKEIRKLNSKTKIPDSYSSIQEIEHSFNKNTLDTLRHYLSMPIPQIQNYQFTYQTYDFINSEFMEFEEEWRKQRKQTVRYKDEHEVIIDFGDGFAWYNLGVSECSEEAGAMGHCGNSASAKHGEQILSLRHRVETPIQSGNGDIYLRPVLTFIYDTTNQTLGEMKGRGNDKPSPKYHKYIIPLLMHPMIQGIRGGGYKPENNFSIMDLTGEQQEEILDKKPQLGNVVHFYHKKGLTPKVHAMLMDALYENNMDIEKIENHDGNQIAILKTYSNLESFVSDIDDTVVENLIELVTDFDNNDVFEIPNRLQYYDEDEVTDTLRKWNREHNFDITYDEYVDVYEKYYPTLKQELQSKILKRIHKYIDRGWYFALYQISYDYPDTPTVEQLENTEFVIYTSVDELVNYLEAKMTGFNYDGDYDIHRALDGYGNVIWATTEPEYMEERRSASSGFDDEKKLINNSGEDLFLDKLKKNFDVHKFILDLYRKEYQDPRQLDLFDEIQALKRRAGII